MFPAFSYVDSVEGEWEISSGVSPFISQKFKVKSLF